MVAVLVTLEVLLLELLVTPVVGLVVSLLELVVSPPPFFASFKIFSFTFFIKFSLPFRPASTHFGSLSIVTFCEVLSFLSPLVKAFISNDIIDYE